MTKILTDEEVSEITGIGFEATGRAIEQAILNKLREVEPVAWLHQTRTSSDVITDEVKMFLLRQYERWEFHSSVQRPSVCKAENYTKPLYLHPAPSVPEGWTAIHLKTGNEYQVIGEAIDATNMHCNQLMVIYQRDGKMFVREAEEFQEKFKASVSAAYIGKTLK